MPDPLVFLNGRPVGPFAPAIGVTDAGFAIGEGVFETMTAQGGRILRRERHVARMAEGCALLGMPPANWAEVDLAIDAFRQTSPADRLNVRFTQTRGPLAGGFGSAAVGPATSVVAVRPAAKRATVLTAALVEWPRRNPQGIATRFKSLGYGNESVARAKAVAMGADTAVMLATDGRVSSADSANLFLQFGTRLVTPSDESGPLCGTVRAALLDAAPQDFEIVAGDVVVSDLEAADALYATNAGFEICAIASIVNLRTAYCPSLAAETVDRVRKLLRAG